jgi:hypothetical protein
VKAAGVTVTLHSRPYFTARSFAFTHQWRAATYSLPTKSPEHHARGLFFPFTSSLSPTAESGLNPVMAQSRVIRTADPVRMKENEQFSFTQASRYSPTNWKRWYCHLYPLTVRRGPWRWLWLWSLNLFYQWRKIGLRVFIHFWQRETGPVFFAQRVDRFHALGMDGRLLIARNERYS